MSLLRSTTLAGLAFLLAAAGFRPGALSAQPPAERPALAAPRVGRDTHPDAVARLTAEGRAALGRLGKRAGAAAPKADRKSADAHGDPLPAGARARLGTVRLRHAGQIDYLTLSPDGSLLASGNYHPEAVILVSETATGKQVLRRRAPEGFNVHAMVFTQDGKTLALAGQGISNDFARVHFWDVASGAEVRRCPIPVNTVPFAWVAAFSPDGKMLAVGCDRIHLLDAATGALRHTLTPGKGHATALAFVGDLLATACDDSSLCLWDPDSGKRLASLTTDLAYTLACGPAGKLLAAAGPGRPVRLWKVARGAGGGVQLTPRKPPQGHEQGATALAFSKDGKLLAAGAAEGGLWLWDPATGKRLRYHRWAAVHARAAGFDREGCPLVVGAAPHANGLGLLDATTGRQLLAGPVHHDSIRHVAFSPDSKVVASLCAAGVLHLWRADDGKHLGRPAIPGSDADEALFTPDGKLLVSTASALYRLDGADGKAVRLPLPLPAAATHTLSQDGTRLAVAQAVDAQGKPAAPNFFHPERTRLLIGLWDVAAGKELCRLPVQPSPVLHCTLSPDGRVLATFGWGVKLWEAATGRLLSQSLADVLAQGVAFSPSGRLLAVREFAPGGKQRVSLWEVASGQMVRRWALLPGERLGFNHAYEKVVTFSPDGRVLATDAYRGAVHFWDVATGRLLSVLSGQGGPIAALAFAPDGKTLAAGNADTTVLLWDVGALRPLAPAGKPLTPADFARLWDQLADARAATAYAAAAMLETGGGKTAAWLRGRLAPARPFDAQRVGRLVEDLGHDRFEVREKAMRELERLGESAENALRRVLAKPQPLEMKRRAEQLLEAVRRRVPERLRALRAVDVLEQVGTPEAREVLRALAGGAPEARLTQEARASLRRLAARAVAP